MPRSSASIWRGTPSFPTARGVERGTNPRNLGAAATAFGKAPPASFEQRIYEATPQAILQVIKETGPKTGTLLVIGHNPSLQELAAKLIASGDIDTRERLGEDFPTSALAAISLRPTAGAAFIPTAAGWSIS